MTAMFPDSGVPAADARNTIPDANTVANCNELWYSTTRCQPRFDPAAANAVLAELINAINCVGMPYDCSRLDNLCTAIEYHIQQGDANCLMLADGPFDYTGNLHPPLMAYPADCCMMLKAIPNVTNGGPIRINVNGLGFVPVVRSDGQPLQFGDWQAGVPVVIIYCGGRFVVPGLSASQVPIVVTGAIDVWIRTDGNDATGDGSANTAAKAFRTINGAWARVSSRYAASASLTIAMRLGIPGLYECGNIGSYGGNLSITGDKNNPAGYRIDWQRSLAPYPSHLGNLGFYGVASVYLQGLTFECSAPAGQWHAAVIAIGSRVGLDTCRWNIMATDTRCSLVYCQQNSTMVFYNINTFEGNGCTIGEAFLISFSSNVFGISAPGLASLYVNNLTFTGGFVNCGNVSTYQNGSQMIVFPSNTHGPKYSVSINSSIGMNGQPQPGDLPGAVGAFSTFSP